MERWRGLFWQDETGSTYMLLIGVFITRETLVLGAGLAALAGDGFDFLFGTVGEVARVGVVGRHCCL